jgi:hypothetical protein
MPTTYHYLTIIVSGIFIAIVFSIIMARRKDKLSKVISRDITIMFLTSIAVFSAVQYFSYFTIFERNSGWYRLQYFNTFVPIFLVGQMCKEIVVFKLKKIKEPTVGDRNLFKNLTHQGNRIGFLILVLIMYTMSVIFTVTSKY